MENNNSQVKNTLEEIKNVTKPLPRNADVFQKLETQTSNVIRASLRDWQTAYEIAKDVDQPDRDELLEIFETIEIDTHVTAVTETIFQGISSMDFIVKNANNEADEDLTALFKTSWFENWLAITVESIFWGFSGIQYGPVEDDKFTKIKSIPRFNIRPEQDGIATDQNRQKADIFFENEPYKTWTSLVYPRMFGDQYQLGKYNKIAKWFILKREVTQFWAIFNELFGHPFRVTKTDIKDNVRRQNAINAMEAMTTASYGVIDLDDEIEFIAPGAGTGWGTFDKFLEVADKQMSKALIGSTMVVDDGSSRSQSETHQKNTNAFIVGYSKIVQNFINDELIPKMAKIGIGITTNDKFQYEHIEKLTKKEWTEIIKILSENYDVDPEFVTEQTGVPVEEKILQIPTQTDIDNIDNKSPLLFLHNFYKKIIKK